MSLGSFLGGLAKGALPIVGNALFPGIGGVIGGAVAGGLSGAGQQNKANKQGQSALDLALQRRTETAPMRTRALQMASQGLQAPREDLSSIFADAGNVYSRTAPRPTAVPNAALPVAPPPPMVTPMRRPRPGVLGAALGERLQ